MAKPSERPILFSGPMVRAILAGQKSQTRRVIWRPERFKGVRSCAFCCPFGEVGDRLWVRETWRSAPMSDCVHYRADPDEPEAAGCWRPSIFMPRWASRITLEVEGVRIERLQEISGSDIRAEGVACPWHYFDLSSCGEACRTLRDQWVYGWDKLNGKRAPWESNPWVWVISFRVLEVRRG